MTPSDRLIVGNATEINRQLTIMSAQAREGKGPVEKPILMTAAAVTSPKGGVGIILHVIVESSR